MFAPEIRIACCELIERGQRSLARELVCVAGRISEAGAPERKLNDDEADRVLARWEENQPDEEPETVEYVVADHKYDKLVDHPAYKKFRNALDVYEDEIADATGGLHSYAEKTYWAFKKTAKFVEGEMRSLSKTYSDDPDLIDLAQTEYKAWLDRVKQAQKETFNFQKDINRFMDKVEV